jgi:hypothetical protein
MASKRHILRLIDAVGEVRRAPLVGVQFLHEPAVGATAAGALLLGATDRAIGMMERFATCFHDERRPEWIEHEVATRISTTTTNCATIR